MMPIPYKVWGDYKYHIRHEDTSQVEGPYVHVVGTIWYLFDIR